MSSIGSGAERIIYGHTGTPPNPLVPPPEVTAPIPMPDPDDPLLLARKRQSITKQYAARGRASTILSDLQGEPLGGSK